jgi:subtilisin family serine protease
MGQFRAPWTRRFAGLGLAATAALAIAGVTALPAQAQGRILGAGTAYDIAGSYIVVYKDGSHASTSALAAQHGAKVTRTYSAALHGFAATMSEAAARRLAADPDVAYVQQNHRLTISDTQPNPPSWGLDRIDQRNLPLNSSYTYPNTAANVHAYVIDTGIRFSHQTFGGRAASGFDAIDGGSADDCHGHGTHVAGTVGGSQYGVAKAVQLVGVRVLDCNGSGSTDQVVAGIDWVTANAIKPAVANMSLGGGIDAVLDAAVQRSIASGVTYAIAAGNGNALGIGVNACNTSPARVPEAITVGATQSNDSRATFSNYGTCVDIFAPGVGITSSWNTSDTATNSISGTSMATPHVVGAAALYLSTNPSATPAQVASALTTNATPNVVGNPGSGSPNRLLFVGSGGTPPPPTGCTGTNGTDVPIPDLSTASSRITISGCGHATASAGSTAEVHIRHTYRGDLVVDLLAPDGSVYNLLNRSGGSADNVDQTFSVNLSSEQTNGTWTLRVRDAARFDSGTIDGWVLTV